MDNENFFAEYNKIKAAVKKAAHSRVKSKWRNFLGLAILLNLSINLSLIGWLPNLLGIDQPAFFGLIFIASFLLAGLILKEKI